MSMMLKPKAPKVTVVPDGAYSATLVDVRLFENAYGQRVGFEFTLHGDGVEGQTIMRSTTPKLSAQGKLVEIISGLAGRPLTTEELRDGFDIEKLIGTDCRVLVIQSRSKTGSVFSNVERVLPN
jgi:hypothetical protein